MVTMQSGTIQVIGSLGTWLTLVSSWDICMPSMTFMSLLMMKMNGNIGMEAVGYQAVGYPELLHLIYKLPV